MFKTVVQEPWKLGPRPRAGDRGQQTVPGRGRSMGEHAARRGETEAGRLQHASYRRPSCTPRYRGPSDKQRANGLGGPRVFQRSEDADTVAVPD